MAAALIPLIASLAPSVINLITGLVHKTAPIVEATNGPATGPVKFASVFETVIGALQSAAAAGQIDKQLPPDDLIKLVIQSVVSSLKLSGQLGSDTVQPLASSQSLVLKAGQTLTLTIS